MEEAKAELQDLKGSDEDEACYGEGGAEGEGNEGSKGMLVGHKRGRD